MRNNYGFWDQRLMSWELSFWCCLLNIPAGCNQSIHWIVKQCYTLLLLVVYSSCLKFFLLLVSMRKLVRLRCKRYATNQIVPEERSNEFEHLDPRKLWTSGRKHFRYNSGSCGDFKFVPSCEMVNDSVFAE